MDKVLFLALFALLVCSCHGSVLSYSETNKVRKDGAGIIVDKLEALSKADRKAGVRAGRMPDIHSLHKEDLKGGAKDDAIGVDTPEKGSQEEGLLTTDNYPYHAILDDNYQLKWNFNSTHIIFNTRVKTKGYMGLGISKNGAMHPSDVIIAWVKDDHVHLGDRHAVGQEMPLLDTQQDWHLVSGTEQGDYTTITMIRKLDTCDDEDIPITPGTTKLIFSYSPDDPISDEEIHWHGDHRGTKSMLLLDPEPRDVLPTEDYITLDILKDNYKVPSDRTTYACNIWKLPPLDGKHHYIRSEPIVPEGHEGLVHHMSVHTCKGKLPDRLVGHHSLCYHNPPREFYDCSDFLTAWAVGGKPLVFPSNVGWSMGGPDDPQYFLLETHYNNIHMRDDFVDSSGVRLYLTKQLRPHDAGFVHVGVNVDIHLIVPPLVDNFMVRGFCHEGCLAEAMDDEEEIHVFSVHLHAHTIGKSIRFRHIRDGVELPTIMEEDPFDFAFQQRRLIPGERTIKKGDHLIVECYYDSTNRNHTTLGGMGSDMEMCSANVMFYPYLPLSYCMSRLEYSFLHGSSPRKRYKQITGLDLTDEKNVDMLVQEIQTAPIRHRCTGTKRFKFSRHVTPQPNVTVPFTPVDQCKP